MKKIAALKLTDDELTELYGLICDAAERTMFPGEADPDDGLMHTSDEARAVATAVVKAIGLGEAMRESVERHVATMGAGYVEGLLRYMERR